MTPLTPAPIGPPWLATGRGEGTPSPAGGACGPSPTALAPPPLALSSQPLGLTHKVRSLGMWLKLDTGMVVMLLLFRVLTGKPESVSIRPAGATWEGE